jgi:hypothetical protein
MPQNQRPPELSGNPELPKFGDRLPDLTSLLRQAGRELENSLPNQTYIPYWEDVYAGAHTLKGVLYVLNCPKPMADFIRGLTDTLLSALAGTKICRRNKEAGLAFQELAQVLDQADPEAISINFLENWLVKLHSLYEEDVAHEERLRGIPPHLFYVNDMVSKKAREVELLNLNFCVVEDQILLDDIPLWRTQLNDALTSPEFGRGIVVNFLPFLSSEGSRTLKAWAWVAAATYSRAALKQRIKEIMPKVTITKL